MSSVSLQTRPWLGKTWPRLLAFVLTLPAPGSCRGWRGSCRAGPRSSPQRTTKRARGSGTWEIRPLRPHRCEKLSGCTTGPWCAPDQEGGAWRSPWPTGTPTTRARGLVPLATDVFQGSCAEPPQRSGVRYCRSPPGALPRTHLPGREQVPYNYLTGKHFLLANAAAIRGPTSVYQT